MEIPQEIIDSRVLIVKPDTDLELIISVEHYNSRMALARRKMRSVLLLERLYFLMNVSLLIAIGVIGIKTGGMFILQPRIEWLEYTALGLFAAAFFWFGLIKRNFIVLTAFSFLLIIMDLRYGITSVLNIIITVFHRIKLSDLKGKQGYPFFMNIHIERENAKSSDTSGQTPEQAVNEILKIPLDKSE